MSDEKPNWDGAEVEVSITATFRYKVRAESYGGLAGSLAEALEIDMTNIKADPIAMLEIESSIESNDIDWMADWRAV